MPGEVTDWEFTYCVLRERVFRCERRGYLWVSTSKEMVCSQLQTPCFSENKNTQKLIQNTRKYCLRHATNVRFSKIRGWCHIPRFLPESLYSQARMRTSIVHVPPWLSCSDSHWHRIKRLVSAHVLCREHGPVITFWKHWSPRCHDPYASGNCSDL